MSLTLGTLCSVSASTESESIFLAYEAPRTPLPPPSPAVALHWDTHGPGPGRSTEPAPPRLLCRQHAWGLHTHRRSPRGALVSLGRTPTSCCLPPLDTSPPRARSLPRVSPHPQRRRVAGGAHVCRWQAWVPGKQLSLLQEPWGPRGRGRRGALSSWPTLLLPEGVTLLCASSQIWRGCSAPGTFSSPNDPSATPACLFPARHSHLAPLPGTS